jgi:hypothetical protein
MPKLWCSLAWIEQYWNDYKLVTIEQCDNTITTSRPRFPSLWQRPAR